MTITFEERPGSMMFDVGDEGPGAGPHVLQLGSGFTGMTDRLAAVGERCRRYRHREPGS